MTLLQKVIVCLSLVSGLAQAQAPPSGPPELLGIRDVQVNSCAGLPEAEFVNSAMTGSIVRTFGYDLQDQVWACSVLKADWVKVGVVVKLDAIPAQLDTYYRVTVVRPSTAGQLWVVPISHGMVEEKNVIDDVHNRAALNALLEANEVHPQTREMWISIALFYLNMIGSEHHINDWTSGGRRIAGMQSMAPKLRTYHLLPTLACEEKYCTVTINDLGDRPGESRYTAWQLTFLATPKNTRLEQVERSSKKLR